MSCLPIVDRKLLLICRKIGLPLNLEDVVVENEGKNKLKIGHDSYHQMLIEYELVEIVGFKKESLKDKNERTLSSRNLKTKEEQVMSRVIHKGLLNLHEDADEMPKTRIKHLINHLDRSKFHFSIMEVVHLESARESEASQRDFQAIKLAVAALCTNTLYAELTQTSSGACGHRNSLDSVREVFYGLGNE